MTDSFDQIYEKYGPMVLRRCQQLLGDEARAAEAMQDTFVRFLANQERLVNAGLSSLLYRIATNTCLNAIRQDSRHAFLSTSIEDDLLREIADRSDLEPRMVARNFISKLFSMDQESTGWMAVLFYHDGLTLEEVAEESGLSVSGVRKRLRKLGINLRKLEEEQ